MYVTDTPYLSKGQDKKVVTTADSIDFAGKTAVIHNTGPNVLYFCASDFTVTTDSPELAVNEKTFPRTGKLNLLSAGTSTLKIEYIDQVG